jgi:translocation and assembly module TamB
LAGHVDARAALGGTLGSPQYQGRVTGQQLGAQNALLGIYLSDGQLMLNLQGTQAQLEQLTLKGGSDQGGLLSISGQASLSGKPEANLQIKAERFGLLNRSDRRARVTGQAQVQIKGQDSVKVEGNLTFDEGLFDVSRIDTPTVGDDVNVINRPGQVDDSADGNDTSAVSKRQWYVQLGLNLGQQLRVKGRGLDTRLSGSLRLSTPNGRPQVHGAVAAVDGSYVSYGQKLVIERGTLNFSGPLDNPRLDIKAMRAQSPTAESSDVKVGVLISGTAVDPRVRLYSEPPMSETEKLSWLVLGRGPTGLGVADIGLLQTAASALWGGEGAAPEDTLVGTLGLDELSIRQTDGAVRDTIVSQADIAQVVLGLRAKPQCHHGYVASHLPCSAAIDHSLANG